MNLLWLGTSSDLNPRVPAPERVPAVVARRVEEVLGGPIDVEVRSLWPSPGLVDLVERWVDRYEPTAVVLIANSYWFTYESVPLRVRRLAGPVGRKLADLGERAAAVPAVAENVPFRVLRRLALRVVGGELAISPEGAVALLDEIVRRVAAREDVVLVVRGPAAAHDARGTRAGARLAERRRLLVERELRSRCARLHVAYVGWETPPIDATNQFGDRVHMDAATHGRMGDEIAAALVAAWRRAHGDAGSDFKPGSRQGLPPGR